MEALEGARVAVRIVERSDPETLVAACRGHLGAPTPGKQPALLWPVPAGSETSLATWKTHAPTCTAGAFAEALPIPDARFCTSSRAR